MCTMPISEGSIGVLAGSTVAKVQVGLPTKAILETPRENLAIFFGIVGTIELKHYRNGWTLRNTDF